MKKTAGKCLSSLILSEPNSFFLPSECDCAPGGGEAVVHAWRHIVEEFQNNPEFIGLKIDLRNAFNAVSRSIL